MSDGVDLNRWKALAVCMVGGFMSMLDVSVINVALPSVEQTLQADATQLQLVVSGYTLALALCVIPGGRLGDVHGRRRLFIIGIAGFGLSSLLVALSASGTMLAAARVLQGAFAGMINPQSTGMIQQLFSGAERGKAFGIFGSMIGVSTAIGPLFGGLLIQSFGPEYGWRAVFLINVPIVAVVIPLARKLLPGAGVPAEASGAGTSGGKGAAVAAPGGAATTPGGAGAKATGLDLSGIAMVALATLCVMTPFILSSSNSITFIGRERWFFLPVGFLLLIPLFFHERSYHRKHGSALFDPVLLRDPSFRRGVGIGSFYFGGFTSVILVVTVMLQQGMGYTALHAGILAMFYAVASAIASNVAGRLVGKYGRKVVVASLSIVLLGLGSTILIIRFAGESWMQYALAASLFCTGFGGGATISPNNALTLASVPVRIGGVAGAMMQVFQQLGSAIGMSVVLAGFFFNSTAMGARASAGHSLLASLGLIACALFLAFWDAHTRGAESNPLAAH